MQKRTKIIATIGPASAKREIVKEMIENGMNLARINFSHGTHDSNGKLIDVVQELREEMNLPIGIMADLQGPRIRIMVEEDVVVKSGEYVLVGDLSTSSNFKVQISKFKKSSNDEISNFENIIKLDKKDIINCLKTGDDILIEDGKIRLEVAEIKNDIVLCEVLAGGTIKNRKGVNIPDANLAFGALTKKDENDLDFVTKKKVDFVALSFVGGKDDLLNLRQKLEERKSSAKIVSKIERKKAIENIDEIIEGSDVIMVARGDLGIELPETKVVVYQKEIIGKCLKKNKPVIVATQMLESMIENPLPTRAEVSDVTNAVVDHTDAVMLSGESANGKYPAETVETMAQIIHDTEESRFDDSDDQSWCKEISGYGAVINSAYRMARDTNSRAIFMFSFSGNTPLMMSKHRPERLMLVATNNRDTFFHSSVLWGIKSFLMEKNQDIDAFSDFLKEKGLETGILKKGDKVVLIIGKLPDGKKMRLIGLEKVE